MKDVSGEYEQMRAELMLMRVELGLDPCHDLLTCVRTLHNDGRDAFEKLRGPKCDYAHHWQPRR
jgi:hypothetical protein